MLDKPDDIDSFLGGVHIARMATVREDGRPHIAPIWYMWKDGAIYMETGHDTVKAKNLRHDPRCAISVDVTGGGMRNRYIIIEGEAEFIEDAEQVQKIVKQIYIRYLGEEALLTPTVQEMLEADIFVIKVEPQHIAHADTLNPPHMGAL